MHEPKSSPLHVAAQNNHVTVTVVTVLRTPVAGPNVKAEDNEKWSPPQHHSDKLRFRCAAFCQSLKSNV
jgi:hypothetical protein